MNIKKFLSLFSIISCFIIISCIFNSEGTSNMENIMRGTLKVERTFTIIYIINNKINIYKRDSLLYFGNYIVDPIQSTHTEWIWDVKKNEDDISLTWNINNKTGKLIYVTNDCDKTTVKFIINEQSYIKNLYKID